MLLGITLLSVGALATFGSAAIDDTRHSVDVQSAEHALSQLDSRVSLVALSEADRQSVALGRGRQGTYTVHPDAGQITVTHLNYSNNGDEHVLYNDSLGEVRYDTGETTLAYQGGGVWRSASSGGSSIVSTPEFHYRGMTLTLPIVRVEGDGSVSGSAQANVYSNTTSVSIYPDHDEPYPDTSRNYTNPVHNGTVQIAVESNYYRAWAEYFASRTDGEVSIDDENETAIVELVSTGTYGDFEMPMDRQPIELRAVGEGHPLDDFSVTIAPDQPDSQQFSGFMWSLWAEQGNKQFEISLESNDKTCPGTVAATVYYSDGSEKHVWYDDDAYDIYCTDADGDGDEEPRITANFTSEEEISYDTGTPSLIVFKDAALDANETATFDQHGDSISWESGDGVSFTSGDTTTMDNVTNHYVGLLGQNVDLVVRDGHHNAQANGNKAGAMNPETSYGNVMLNETGQYVTYLHVSENNVTVDIR
ncbi:hypothetical protein [Halanaeroarchaeum sp. HSR-CO]|uniref:DUF7289 family protein n=1 Tax=Halanaeroarchaeum sp. HSR-CO TaxID=2866382 RepID=UPI00217D4F8E|nr:hypothetical protein [Halanaeroarchaeum sp. HSR-CO]